MAPTVRSPVERQLARAARTAAEATARRDALVVALLAEGRPLRYVAALAGLSHTAVANIRDRKGPQPAG